jgi:hypothetical protein
MSLSRHQNAGQKMANRSFENVSQFRYLETIVTNQNLFQEEIKRRLNSDIACYHSLSVFSSAVEKRNNENIQDIILPVFLYGCKTWSLTFREVHRVRIFENWALRAGEEILITRSFVIYTLRQVQLEWSILRGLDGRIM